MGVALVGYSLPSFFIGLVLIFFVILKWHWLPFPAVDLALRGSSAFVQTMLLPWIVIAILYAAFYMRLTRNQVLEVFGDDYIRTARAKGLPERTVVTKHALRAGLTPIVTGGRARPRRAARWRDHHREHLQPARGGLARHRLGRQG